MNIVICQAQIKHTDLVQANGLQIGKLFDHVRYVLHMMYMTLASCKENQGMCNYRAPGAGLSGQKIGHGKGDCFTPCHSEAAHDWLTRLGEIQNSNHVRTCSSLALIRNGPAMSLPVFIPHIHTPSHDPPTSSMLSAETSMQWIQLKSPSNFLTILALTSQASSFPKLFGIELEVAIHQPSLGNEIFHSSCSQTSHASLISLPVCRSHC